MSKNSTRYNLQKEIFLNDPRVTVFVHPDFIDDILINNKRIIAFNTAPLSRKTRKKIINGNMCAANLTRNQAKELTRLRYNSDLLKFKAKNLRRRRTV